MPLPINFRALFLSFALFRSLHFAHLHFHFFLLFRASRVALVFLLPILCVPEYSVACVCVWIRKYIRTLLQIIFDGPIIYRVIYSLDLLCCVVTGNFIHILRIFWFAGKIVECVFAILYWHGVLLLCVCVCLLKYIYKPNMCMHMEADSCFIGISFHFILSIVISNTCEYIHIQ